MIETKREKLNFDVVIVGAGPAGLAAAIKIRQLSSSVSVAVLEKGAEVGSHILSGAVLDPVGIDLLFPKNWRTRGDHPFKTPAKKDEFIFLGSNNSIGFPGFMFPFWMKNKGSYIVSLGSVCRWLALEAEALGVQIFPSVSAVDLLFDSQNHAVTGILTGEIGVKKDGSLGQGFVPGVEIRGKYILIGEGARGSLAKKLLERYYLSCECSPQKYALGLKELWRVSPEQHRPGLVQHFIGWPLDNRTAGGGFLYHLDDCLVSVGFVVHLDYKNPSLSPFEEFQRFKTHLRVRQTFESASRLSYGARVISAGGWQSIPRLSFPGGVLIGCAAGFMNLPRVKGAHNAILSGILAAEHVIEALSLGRENDELVSFDMAWRESFLGKDLWRSRNFKPLWSWFGTLGGGFLGCVDIWLNTLLRFSPFGTLSHKQLDFASLEPAALHKRILYPLPDRKISFDLPSSVFLSGVHHKKDQPCHLQIKDPELQRTLEHDIFGGPSAFYCPAGVYEWLTEKDKEPRLVVNAENCIHCKTCDVKDPGQNIEWVPPQGGEGPLYSGM